MKDILALISSLALAAIVTIFTAYVMWDILQLFNVPLLNNLRHIHILGMLYAMQVSIHTKKKSLDDDPFNSLFFGLLDKVFGNLFLWGMAYAVHYFYLQLK